jgi:FkbM family methyltransferase
MMVATWVAMMKRLRENYYCSMLLAWSAKPIQKTCSKLGSQIKRKVRKNGVRVQLPNGLTMRIARDSGIWLASLLFWDGIDGYERETSKTLRFFFSRVSTFVDVGANYGLYAIVGALWNSKILVVAFEASPSICGGLKKNVALNGLGGRITCENIALANRSGPTILYSPKSEGKDAEATGTLATNSWQVRQDSRRLEVEALRFDDYESSHPMKVGLIKIDVEDFEADVLAGMRRIILRDRPFIVCEVLPRPKEHKNQRTLEVVESLGYIAYWITPCGYIRVSRFDFERTHTDFLLSPVLVSVEVVTDLDAFWMLYQRTYSATNRIISS